VGNWGFIALAYGVAAVALLGYLVGLKGRLRQVSQELTALEKAPRGRRA
jgi:hypothetical protein